MKKIIYTTLTVMFLALSLSLYGQSGAYDVQFNMNSIDCNTNQLFIDIEVKAPDAGTSFNMSEQNYRFSFTREALANPTIVQELTISGALSDSNGDFSAYNPHNLNGSADTVVSYNVELAFGTGYYIGTEWVSVGRIAFDVIDADACMELIWHDHAPESFPPTFIGEKVAANLYEAEETTYGNVSDCIPELCGTNLPIELSYFIGKAESCTNILSWGTESETNNEYFELLKSDDGQKFYSIAKINGAGDSETAREYSFTDENVARVNYYRLRQVDLDGTVSYSEDISIKSDCFENISDGIEALFPNPVATGEVTFQFYTSRTDNEATIIISDALGRKVIEQNTTIESGTNLLSFDPSQLAAGTYFVKVVGEKWFSSSQKFVKINN